MKKKDYDVIFIDSKEKTITTKKCSCLKDLQNLVGGYIETGMRMDNEDDLYVDEEGLLSGPESFFLYKGAHQPFAGNGVVVGCDEDGDSTDHKTDIETVRASVKFLSKSELLEILKNQ